MGEAGLHQLLLFLFAQVPRQERDAPTVEDWETFGRRGRAGQETTAVNIFEKQRNLLWANGLKQLIKCLNYNSRLLHILFYIMNANLIVKMRDMGKDQVAPDHPDNPSSGC